MKISEIRSDIPPPPDYRATPGRGRPARYPFVTLDVGESFTIDGDRNELKRLRKAASNASSTQGKKFSVRIVEPGLFRCWRLS